MRGKRIDPFEAMLYVIFDEPDYRALAKRFDWESDEPHSVGMVMKSHLGAGPPFVTVWIDGQYHDRSTRPQIVNTVAHEAVHAAGCILEHIGEDDNFGSETLAYLTGFIAEHIYKEWEKRSR